MFAKELKDGDLANIVGGTLTPEAEDWVQRNKSAIIKKAGMLGFLADKALDYVRTSEEVYDIAGLKKAIKDYGINVDDLN